MNTCKCLHLPDKQAHLNIRLHDRLTSALLFNDITIASNINRFPDENNQAKYYLISGRAMKAFLNSRKTSNMIHLDDRSNNNYVKRTPASFYEERLFCWIEATDRFDVAWLGDIRNQNVQSTTEWGNLRTTTEVSRSKWIIMTRPASLITFHQTKLLPE